MNIKKGQSLVEFAIMGLLILALSVASLRFFGGALGDLFEQNNARSLYANNTAFFNQAERTALPEDD